MRPVCFFAIVLSPCAWASEAAVPHSAPAYLVPGMSFSPYIDGQDPNLLSQVPLTQIQARMRIIAPYTQWIRSFGMQYGLENIPAAARSYKKKVAAGAALGRDGVQNSREISNLIAAAQAGLVDIAIVGSEVLLRGDLSETQLLGYMSQVKLAVPANVLVTTADTWAQLLAHPKVIAASDVLAANFYPYWEKVPISKAVCSLRAQYHKLVAASAGKQVIVSETGWPSDGNPQGGAVAGPANATRFFVEFVSWARANNVTYWYFEAFDESWKAAYEGPQGAHWGIWDKDGVMKPGMQAVFTGQTTPIDCTACGTGTPSLSFTYLPPMGSHEWIEGQACHIDPVMVKLVFYINVDGIWWVKPYDNATITPIAADGSWSNQYVTGGSDYAATQFAAFVIPNGYSAPVLRGSPSLPPELYQAAIAWKQAARSSNSISGTIADVTNVPVGGVTLTLTGAGSASTASALSGKYSFVTVPATGTSVVTPSLSGYSFAPHDRVVTLAGGASTANFAATAPVDLGATGRFSPSAVVPGKTSVYTLTLANSGPGPATAARLAITLPPGITLAAVSTTRGSCNPGSPIQCSAGVMLSAQVATITLTLRAGGLGLYAVTSIATTPEPDSNLLNNTLTQQLAVCVSRSGCETPHH